MSLLPRQWRDVVRVIKFVQWSCLLASASYVLGKIINANSDQMHVLKHLTLLRPIDIGNMHVAMVTLNSEDFLCAKKGPNVVLRCVGEKEQYSKRMSYDALYQVRVPVRSKVFVNGRRKTENETLLSYLQLWAKKKNKEKTKREKWRW